MAAPEDNFDFDDTDDHVGPAIEHGLTARLNVLAMNDPFLRAARRELQWFYGAMQGRVPGVGEAAMREVAAASRIAGWLAELQPYHRGAFVVRYDGRRWPARIAREFGGITSLVVRLAAMERPRGPTETVAEVEKAVVADLLTDIAATNGPLDVARCAVTLEIARELRRLRRDAKSYLGEAESAYSNARGCAECAAPLPSRRGA